MCKIPVSNPLTSRVEEATASESASARESWASAPAAAFPKDFTIAGRLLKHYI